MGQSPKQTPRVDLTKLREKALTALRALPALAAKGVALLNPFGIVRSLSAITAVAQKRWVVQIMTALFCSFFLAIGLYEAVSAGASDKMFLILVAYGIWTVVNSATHGLRISDCHSLRPIYMVAMDMAFSACVLTMGVLLYTGLATLMLNAAICGALVAGGVFAVLAVQFETGKLEDAS
jgi:hypothetical protein